MTNPEEMPKLDESNKELDGQSFYNNALTGSGTITQDGEYAPPLPDPTAVRGLGPNRTSGGRRVDVGEGPVANLGVPESDADSEKGSQRAPAVKSAAPKQNR